MIDEPAQPPLVEQIARKAAETSADHFVTANLIHREERPRATSILKSHILAAVEKAHQTGWHEGRQYQVEYGTPVQPQHSDMGNPMTGVSKLEPHQGGI